MTQFRVVKFVRNEDMRAVHDSRHRYSRSLGPKEVVLAINRRANIIRVITPNAGVCHWYADDGMQFDMVTIQAAVSALSLTLRLTDAQVNGVERVRKAAVRRLKQVAAARRLARVA